MWFVDKIGKIFHINFLEYAHWFISIRISQLKENYISVYQARYYTFVFENDLNTSTIEENAKCCETTLPHDMMFTEEYDYTSDN